MRVGAAERTAVVAGLTPGRPYGVEGGPDRVMANLERLGIDPTRVPRTFPDRGNIGPASVPFTLAGEAQVGTETAGVARVDGLDAGSDGAREMAMVPEPEFVPAEWESLVSSLERGQFDVIVNGHGGTSPKQDILNNIQFHTKIVDNKFLAVLGVFAHVIFQQVLNMIAMFQNNRLQANVVADESGKFIGADFT